MTEQPPPAETPSEAAPITPPASKAPWIVAGVATAIALAAAMVATSAIMRDDTNVMSSLPAGMQRATFNRPVTGTIGKISGTSFTVNQEFPNGEKSTTTVQTDKDTRFRESVDGALSDLAVDDTIAVTGSTTDGVFTATRIVETAMFTDIAGGTMRAPRAFMRGDAPEGAVDVGRAQAVGPRLLQAGNGRIGTITKIEGDTITIAAMSGESVAVKTTATTAVRINKSIKLADLDRGDTVRVMGATDDDTVTAFEVTKGADDESLAP